ncbi:CrcB family protein [Arthrobacter sp. M4]|uniref:fluoride efflux transporter FluC n=1 Tax=Arthrobacter sp. M4 TaxID=218160 RepID=UPI001CDCEAD2|nr:CrcB family protein [Arthrobacter sp. M4]MCA4132227.1 CrcB family protein [Arthrobacter sp. M4]
MTALLVGFFGTAGALLRFGIDTWFARFNVPARHWPWATLIVNVVGCFVIGLAGAFGSGAGISPDWHTAMAAGLAGGLTTFSSWTTATIRLITENRYRAAAVNIAVNLALGAASAAAGMAITGAWFTAGS